MKNERDGEAKDGSEEMDHHCAANVGYSKKDRDFLVEREHDDLDRRDDEHLEGGNSAEEDAEGDKHCACTQIALQDGSRGERNLVPLVEPAGQQGSQHAQAGAPTRAQCSTV